MRGGLLSVLALVLQMTNPFTTVGSLRNTARPLLIFTADERDAGFRQQTSILAANVDGLLARQVVGMGMPAAGDQIRLDTRIWAIAAAAEIQAERRRFHVAPNDLLIVLIGKDGGEKARWTRPVTFEELRAAIDAMPGRQAEMRQQPPKQQ